MVKYGQRSQAHEDLQPSHGASSPGRLAYPLHAGHPPPQHLGLLEAVLQLLLPQLVLDVEAEGHGALVLLAVLGVVAAQGDQLLAHGAASVGLALAALGVLHHALHLLAGRQQAVGIVALAGVDQGLDAALDAEVPALHLLLVIVALGVVGGGGSVFMYISGQIQSI